MTTRRPDTASASRRQGPAWQTFGTHVASFLHAHTNYGADLCALLARQCAEFWCAHQTVGTLARQTGFDGGGSGLHSTDLLDFMFLEHELLGGVGDQRAVGDQRGGTQTRSDALAQAKQLDEARYVRDAVVRASRQTMAVEALTHTIHAQMRDTRALDRLEHAARRCATMRRRLAEIGKEQRELEEHISALLTEQPAHWPGASR